MKNRNFIVATKIERMLGGFVVHVRWPYGPDPSGCGPVVCETWDDVAVLLREAALTYEDEEKPHD